jgi:catechol 2,3-dioxygenase-like lactoylglutathione lyase family enzyme
MAREESSMSVKRIVTNIATEQVGSAHAFYCGVLGMSVAMDLGWILTFAADGAAAPQVSVAKGGGSGTQVPDISIEVDNLDEIYERVRAGGFSVEHGPVNEPWGVRRFYVRDPFGRLLNILTHG